MTRQQRQALAELGITTERYYVDRPLPIWGLALMRDGQDVAVIEETPRAHGGDGKFHVRGQRTTPQGRAATPHGSYRLQRLAIAGWVRAEYGLT